MRAAPGPLGVRPTNGPSCEERQAVSEPSTCVGHGTIPQLFSLTSMFVVGRPIMGKHARRSAISTAKVRMATLKFLRQSCSELRSMSAERSMLRAGCCGTSTAHNRAA